MKFVKIFLLIIWMIVIFWLSNDSGEASNHKSDFIAHTIYEIIYKISGNSMTDAELESMSSNLSFAIRKTAHFTEYLILGLLMFSVFKDYFPISQKLLFILITLCFIYACTDEFHQLFIAERSGQFTDVLIDSIGSAIGIISYYYFNKRKQHKVI